MARTTVSQPGAHLRVVSDSAATGTSGIAISGVSKTYRTRDGDVPSLKPLDFHINDGEFFVVVGPSGCGKSTLLKMISGLLPPSSGEILVDGKQVTVTRTVRDRKGKVIHRDTYYSNYARITGIVLIGR